MWSATQRQFFSAFCAVWIASLFALLGLNTALAQGSETDVDAKPIKPMAVFDASHTAGVAAIAWAPDRDSVLYSLDMAGFLVATDVVEVKTLWKTKLGGEKDQQIALAVSPDGSRIFVGGSGGIIRTVQASDGSPTQEVYSFGHDGAGAVRSIAVHPKGTGIAAGDVDGYTAFWSSGLSTPVAVAHNHTWPVRWLFFSQSGEYLLSADPVSALLWKTNDNRITEDLSGYLGHKYPGSFSFTMLTFSPQEDAVVTLNFEGFFVYSFASRSVIRHLNPVPVPDDERAADAIAMSPDRSTLMVLSGPGMLLLDIETGAAKGGYLDAAGFPFKIPFNSALAFHPRIPTRFATARMILIPDFSTGSITATHALSVYDSAVFPIP
jgi:hypothetical protein